MAESQVTPAPPAFIPDGQFVPDEEKYGTPGQMALTGLEGAARGVLSAPVVAGAERALTSAGVPGLSPEAQEMRSNTNPVLSGLSEAGGFGAGALMGTGEAALLGKAGEAAATAAGLGKATLATRLATNGIKTGAEIAALQAGNELAKTINSDPSQTLGSAAINVGLSGLIGGAAGIPLGGVSELWTKGLDAADSLINDAKAQVAFRQALEGGEITHVATSELAGEALAPRTARLYDPFTKTFVEPHPEETLFQEPRAAVARSAPFTRKDTAGEKLGDYFFDNGRDALAKAAGESLGGSAGALGGALVGHPLFGAYIGEKTLAPMISSIAKPLLENLTDGAALKGTLNYLSDAIKGAHALDNAVGAFFKGGDPLVKNLLPTADSRSKLQKSLDTLQADDKQLSIGNGLAHYMPNHATAAGALAGNAKGYFDALKPKVAPATPFNQAPPPDKGQQAIYDRALDIAQQPLMVLQHAKRGTLLSQDVQTLSTLYPGLHRALSDKIMSATIDHLATKGNLPYYQRASLSLLTGSTPMDGTLMPQTMRSIVAASSSQQMVNQTRGPTHKAASGAALNTIEKTTKLYGTSSEARQIARNARG